MPREGERVGRFEIVREIGRGGMAVVYLARQTDLDRNVALKQLGAFHATDPAAAARFLQESRITGSLGHPNIVTVHEYLQHDDGTPYIAMEYLERGSLRPMVRSLSLAQFAGVMEGVLSALSHAADQGIVHRDLKPENLMLTRAGTVKVADFGIAKAVNEVQTSFATATGTTVGTPAYMSPEQAMAKGVGPSTDLYAVGVMAYEMLVGRVPYSADTPVAVLLQHVNEPLPSPREAKPDLDPELAGWLESMLAKTPDGRPEDAAAAWDQLEGIVIRILGPRWRRDARLLDGGAPATAEPLTPAPFDSVQSPATPPPGGGGPPAVAPPAGAPPAGAPPAGATELPPAAPAPPPAPSVTGFETFGRPGNGAEAAPAPRAPASPPPVAPAPTGFQTFARPGAAGAAAGGAAEAPADAPAAPGGAEPPSVDGFQTFDPQPRPAAPPPAPEPAPAPVPPEPVVEAPPAAAAEPTAPPVAAVEETVPPRSREITPPGGAPAATPPAGPGDGGPNRRRLVLLGAGAAAVAAVVVVVVVVAGGGGGGASAEAPPPTTAPSGPLAPDRVLEERPDLTAAGGTMLVADPAGRVVRIANGRAAATLVDPAAPVAVATAGDRVVVANRSTVTSATADDLSPVAAVAFPRAVGLATVGQDVAVAGTQGGGGRACLVGDRALGPCADLPFAPTGVGASGDTVFVADGAGGTVVPLARSGGSLTPGTAIPIGTKPHGRMVEDRGRLYIPVERGVGALDLASGASVGTFAMPTTPADVAVDDAGLLIAALPASDQIAVVDTTKAAAQPALIAAGGTPAAVAIGDDGVRVLTTQGDLVPVDAAAGTAAAGVPVRGFGDATQPVRLRRVSSAASGRRVTLTLALAGGTLTRDGLRVADKSIGDGRAALELWQGGIRSNVRAASGGGVRTTVAPRAGRLLVSLAAGSGDFTSMAARLVRDGAAVEVVLTKPAPPPPTTPTTPSGPSTPSGGGGTPSGGGGGTPSGGGGGTPKPSNPGFETG